MRYLRRFNENISVYDNRWEDLLPKEIIIIKGDEGSHKFEKGNVMLNSDMIQITYDNSEWGIPDTLEFDIYFTNIDNRKGDFTLDKEAGSVTVIPNGNSIIRLDIDITYGDLMVGEFSIDKVNGVKLILNPSKVNFTLDDNSLNQFVEFLNRFNHGVKLSVQDFNFLKSN